MVALLNSESNVVHMHSDQHGHRNLHRNAHGDPSRATLDPSPNKDPPVAQASHISKTLALRFHIYGSQSLAMTSFDHTGVLPTDMLVGLD